MFVADLIYRILVGRDHLALARTAGAPYILPMTLDESNTTLKTSTAVPATALAEGVAQADALAPLVFAVADKFCCGFDLLPADSKLLFHGLKILAAARHPALLDQLLALAPHPPSLIEPHAASLVADL